MNSITLPIPTRNYYYFNGWYLDKSFNTPVFSKYDLPYKNVTLYAKWVPYEYSITFKADGKQDVVVDGYKYDQSYKLNNDVFDIPGMVVGKFTYSYVDSKGKTITKTVAGNASIKNLVNVDGGNINLYVAKTFDKKLGIEKELWNNTNYTIKYSLPKGAVNGSKNITKYSYSEQANIYKINNPSSTGHNFLYWTYVDKQGNTQYIYPINNDTSKSGYSYLPVRLHQNITLQAHFESIEYSVTYTGNLGSFGSYNPNPTTYYYSKISAIPLTNPTRAGYTFLGWYNVANNKKVTSIAKGTYGNIVLEARWK